MDVRRLHRASRPAIMALLLAAVVAMVAQGAAPPHTHAGSPGLYNQEHDLTLYAVTGNAALVEAAPAFFVDVALAALSFVAVPRPPLLSRAPAHCRAPPAA
jgi:hypothetical protein